ncbi:hypothetical protein KCU78_g50, partial [Aureobasidium melanogenum]
MPLGQNFQKKKKRCMSNGSTASMLCEQHTKSPLSSLVLPAMPKACSALSKPLNLCVTSLERSGQEGEEAREMPSGITRPPGLVDYCEDGG